MVLTGKCKEDFETWLLVWLKENIAVSWEIPLQEDVDFFYVYPEAMQWGVYADFFDSRGIEICIYVDFNHYWVFIFGGVECGDYKTRKEAWDHALKKVNEIYNT